MWRFSEVAVQTQKHDWLIRRRYIGLIWALVRVICMRVTHTQSEIGRRYYALFACDPLSLSLASIFFFVLLHSIHFGSMIVILACWDSLFVPKRLSVDKCYANSTTLLLLVVHADGGCRSHEMWFRCPNSRQAIEECPLTHLSLSHTHAHNPKLIGIIVCIIFEVEHALSAHSFVLNRFRFTIYSLMILLPPTTRWISIICTNQLSHCGWFIFLPPNHTHRHAKDKTNGWQLVVVGYSCSSIINYSPVNARSFSPRWKTKFLREAVATNNVELTHTHINSRWTTTATTTPKEQRYYSIVWQTKLPSIRKVLCS